MAQYDAEHEVRELIKNVVLKKIATIMLAQVIKKDNPKKLLGDYAS